MLVDAGCKYVILGHSERRRHFGETDAAIHRKVKTALENEIRPILWRRGDQEERQQGKTFEILERQVRKASAGLMIRSRRHRRGGTSRFWADRDGGHGDAPRGPGGPPVHRRQAGVIFRKDLAQRMRVIYGDRFTPANIKELMAQPDIHGALVGGASLEARSFVEISITESEP